MKAWQEDAWGSNWLAEFEPREQEHVVTHPRNSVMHGCTVPDVLAGLGAEHLIFSGVLLRLHDRQGAAIDDWLRICSQHMDRSKAALEPLILTQTP